VDNDTERYGYLAVGQDDVVAVLVDALQKEGEVDRRDGKILECKLAAEKEVNMLLHRHLR
jgi:hypothetical protein